MITPLVEVRLVEAARATSRSLGIERMLRIGIAEHLELFRDAVVQARIGVVRAVEDQDRDAVFVLDRLEDGEALLLQVALEGLESLPAPRRQA